MTRELVYGRRAVREALRGPRAVLELWTSERALAAEPWLTDGDGPRPHVKPDRALSEAAETREHQGVVAFCEPYRYADAYELVTRPSPLLACLDQISDPHNLGAVCRAAEGAGATGVVLPAHRSARVTPAVCRASAGAVEHLPVARVRNLADWLGRATERDAWVYGASADGNVPYDRPDYRGRVVLVLGSEGRGLRPRVAAACDELVHLPARGRIGSLNVSTAAAALVYGILHFRTVLDSVR